LSDQVGLVGYVYQQLSPDSGSGNRVGSFESAGAEVGYSFTAAGLQWYANLRGYGELWAANSLQGFATYATLNIPLGPAPT
jgi:hypothetical protein